MLVVDDVITAGTAVREALALIRAEGGTAVAIAVALDRQEAVDPAVSRRSAAQAVAEEHGLAVVPVVTLSDLLAFAGETAELGGQRAALDAYREAWGSNGAASDGPRGTSE